MEPFGCAVDSGGTGNVDSGESIAVLFTNGRVANIDHFFSFAASSLVIGEATRTRLRSSSWMSLFPVFGLEETRVFLRCARRRVRKHQAVIAMTSTKPRTIPRVGPSHDGKPLPLLSVSFGGVVVITEGGELLVVVVVAYA